jgi:hypothetical protein
MSRRGSTSEAPSAHNGHRQHKRRLRRRWFSWRMLPVGGLRPYSLRRVLPWLPLLFVIAGGTLVVYNMLFVLVVTPLSSTWPYPARASTKLRPGGEAWTVTAHRPKSIVAPSFPPPRLTVEIISLDLASRTMWLRLNLALSDETFAHLRMANASGTAPVPLTRVRRNLWASMPVGIQLTGCLRSYLTPETCGLTATVPLGELVGPNGNPTSLGSSVTAPVEIPVDGSPSRFPFDRYVLQTRPWLSLQDPISLDVEGETTRLVPADVVLAASPGLADYSVTVDANSPDEPITIGFVIDRPLVRQLTVLVMASLPLLLAIVLARMSAQLKGSPDFNLGFAAALIAAMLAILPLRAVLVPQDLGSVALTLVDEILVLAVLFIAGFVFWRYAHSAARARD